MNERITNYFYEYAPKVFFAIILIVVGFWVIKKITSFTRKVLNKKGIDESLTPFLLSMINIGLKVLLIIAIAGTFGIETTSFIAILGALAFAVGMALQGSLGNFASGVLILLFKPYKVGDLIDVQGFVGDVKEIQIFNTIVLTPDNKRVIIPNSSITSGPITNISAEGIIRCDMTFGIAYSDDIDQARKVIYDTAESCPTKLKDREVDIFVSELADSSVNFAVRPWCKSEHYWDTFFYMHENLKKNMDAAGISIPFPQMDVYVQK